MRRFSRALVLVVAACSTKAPNSSPPTRAPHDVAMAPQTSATAGAAPAPSDPREERLAKTVSKLLEEDHLLHKQIDDEISRAAFKTYLDRLDPLKAFLLKSDRDALGRYADQIDDELRSGSLELAHEGEKIYVARIEAVDKLVQGMLAQPMNHADEEWLETDPKKIEPATTEDELKDRWRKRLELEVLERVGQMEARLEQKAKADKDKDKKGSGSGSADEDRGMPLAEIPASPEAREAKARADLAKTYASRFARLSHPEPLDAASELLNAVTSTLDPHTSYLPPADKANFDIQMSGSLEGIGASLRERDHYIEVIELVPGGAAWRQGGLSQGDLILAVQNDGKDPVDVVDMHIDDVVRMIRGPKGTNVRLRVQKADGHEETVAITRDVIVIEDAYARAAMVQKKGGGNWIGYIHLPAFYGGPKGQRTASADIKRLLGVLSERKVAGVILDIRSNGGGLLQDAVKLTGEFFDRGPVVQVRDSEGHKEVLGDDAKGSDYDGPLIVLVDRFSASASEILAGALQDYHRAVIVGTGPTHGKGTVQTLADLDRITGRKDDLGVLKLTIEQFFRVSGASTQLQGVVPDIVLPDPEGWVDTGERQLEHAIAWSQIDAVPHDDWKTKWNTATLVTKSTARVTKNPLLSKIASANEVLRARRNDTRMPLAQTAWENRRKELKAAIDAASPDLVHATPSLAVQSVEDPTAGTVSPGPGGRQDDRPAKWRDSLARDPWVDECVSIIADMTK